MDWFSQILTKSVGGFSIKSMLIVLGCIIAALVLDKISQLIINKLKKYLAKKQAALSEDKQTRRGNFHIAMLEALSKPLHLLMLTLGCSLGLLIIDPPKWAQALFTKIRLGIGSVSLWCFIWYLMRVTDNISVYLTDKAKERGDKVQTMLLPVIRGIVKFIFAAIGVLVVVQNLGYSVGSILTGLGIGGAAIALAAKDTVANFFGSLVVFFDHPFDVGDWVNFSGVDGIVEEIRVRTTLIRSFDGSVIMVPNSVLTNANINNYQRRDLRRLDANFGVLYSTTPEQIEKIVEDITQYIYDHPEILGRRHYIGFSGFGDSSLDIFVMAYSTKIGLAEFCKVRQTFLLAIMRIVAANGTSFAFPTRTIDFSNPLPIGAGASAAAPLPKDSFPEFITEPVLRPQSSQAKAPGKLSGIPEESQPSDPQQALSPQEIEAMLTNQAGRRPAGHTRYNDWSFAKFGNDIRRYARKKQRSQYPWTTLSPEDPDKR